MWKRIHLLALLFALVGGISGCERSEPATEEYEEAAAPSESEASDLGLPPP